MVLHDFNMIWKTKKQKNKKNSKNSKQMQARENAGEIVLGGGQPGVLTIGKPSEFAHMQIRLQRIRTCWRDMTNNLAVQFASTQF